MDRRIFLKQSSTASLAMALPVYPWSLSMETDQRFGVADASYYLRRYRDMKSERYPPFENSEAMLDHCHELGFTGLQTSVRDWDPEFARRIRKKCKNYGMFLEGQISLPHSDEEAKRFTRELQAASEAGISVLRTVCLSGRRYENFDSREAFDAFHKESVEALDRAAPLVEKYQIQLAVENHKDWQVPEILKLLRRYDSQWIGVTLDTGNNIALLEDPMEVVRALAPYTMTVHLKDMAVATYPEGFLLSEVNLGTGFLDLAEMIKTIRDHRPQARFNLEMITRDPLKIPCLTNEYWATFDPLPAAELAVYLSWIRENSSNSPLPLISDQSDEFQLQAEVENNRRSMLFAKNNFGFK